MSIRAIARWLLYDVMHWKKNITVEHPNKYIICLAPHTSNRDFIIGQLYALAEGLHTNYLMKREWFVWPLGPIFRRTGGIPVARDRSTSLTDTLAQAAKEADTFRLCITPEGTRSRNPDWKRGFYYIAQKAGIPILLYGLDYRRHLIECTATVTPTGDIEHELPLIKQHLAAYQGRHPELFAI